MPISRRQFLKLGAGTFAGLMLGPGRFPGGAASVRAAILPAIPGGTLDPTAVPKYAMPLVIPPAMPYTSKQGPFDYYEIAVRQFPQQILPAGPATTVWSYGSANHPDTFNYPAFTIEANSGRPVRIKWINDLKNSSGEYLPHLLPVDPTLHWANPPGGTPHRDMRPSFTGQPTPGPYTGPVPIVTHVHGAHTFEESDGHPEAWFLPNAGGIPSSYAKVGSYYDQFKAGFSGRYGLTWEPGSATFQYPNDQRATTLWYHDHTLGMTRLNVYAGPAGFYLIRGGKDDLSNKGLPDPHPKIGSDPFGKFREIPIAIQDRSFNADNSLFYPDTRAYFDEYVGPYIPESDVPPIWNPEFFGNTMVVNGRTWPYLEVEPGRYRFRLLNGCNSRFLILKIVAAGNVGATRPVLPALPFWQIGAEGGFLPQPMQLGQLLMAPAERADVIVDFSGFPGGTEFYLINEGPDEPFGGGQPEVDFVPSDPTTTGQVMKFVVSAKGGPDTSRPPQKLKLPEITPIGVPSTVRRLSLNEVMSTVHDGPAEALLGTLGEDGKPVSMKWMDPITENPALGSIEEWEIYNFTADAHPIHIHLVQFQVISREGLALNDAGETAEPATLLGNARQPESWESGFKDTVIAYPGEVTRVRALFDTAGLFVWHCHIVEHEDNEMMRPFRVGP